MGSGIGTPKPIENGMSKSSSKESTQGFPSSLIESYNIKNANIYLLFSPPGYISLQIADTLSHMLHIPIITENDDSCDNILLGTCAATFQKGYIVINSSLSLGFINEFYETTTQFNKVVIFLTCDNKVSLYSSIVTYNYLHYHRRY